MRGLHKSDVGCICTCACAHLLRTMVPPRPFVDRRSRRHTGLREKSEYARPDPTQPDPVSLLRSLYLRNGLTDSRAVFFARCHHSINFVFDRHRYPPVPTTARGTCRVRGCRRHPTPGNSTTAGPIAFNFGGCLETS